jgi:hypothetical protein
MIYGLYKLFEEMMAFTLNRNPPNEENKEQEQPEPNVSLFSKIANKKETVNHPEHYGGKENPYEAIKVIRAWELGFSLGNTLKYISRAGKKDPSKRIEDLHKAMWYLQEEINSEYEKLAK